MPSVSNFEIYFIIIKLINNEKSIDNQYVMPFGDEYICSRAS